MGGLDVISLGEGFLRSLPVRIDIERDIRLIAHPIDLEAVEELWNRRQIIQQWFGVGLKSDEDESAPGSGLKFRQRNLVVRQLLRPVFAIRNLLNATVQIPSPSMKTAKKLCRVTASSGQSACAMHAGIVERPNTPILGTDDDYRLVTDLIGDVVARSLEFLFTTGHLPHLRP